MPGTQAAQEGDYLEEGRLVFWTNISTNTAETIKANDMKCPS
ncbi:hypothetical protein [Allocoleopsis sp.]